MRKTKKEIWRPCPGYEKWYDISNFGNIRSYHINNGSGMANIKIVPKPISPSYSPTFEYWYISLSRGIGIVTTFSLHILVAKAFIKNPHRRKFVHHKDNDKQNPCAWNLEWVTAGQNQKYAYADGRRKKPNGILNGRCKLSETQVLEIFNSKGNHYKLASKYNVCRAVIGNIKNGKIWSTLTGKKYIKKEICKLSSSTILRILNETGEYIDVAKKFGVSKNTVGSIKTGRSYSDITGVVFKGKREYEYFGIKNVSVRKAA